MSSHRFFLADELPESPGNVELPLSPSDLHHAVRVVRLKAGEELEVVPPHGASAWRMRVVSVSDDSLVARPIEQLPIFARPRITLVQGVAKGEKMDAIVRQAVEIGADEVVPILSARTVVRMDRRKRAERGERYRRVAKAAAEQSHRDHIPVVRDPMPLSDLVEELGDYDGVAVLWEEAESLSLGSAVRGWAADKDARIALVVGPEGGFSSAEVERLESAGAVPVTLGRGILRTETAATVGLTIALYELGGLGGRGAR